MAMQAKFIYGPFVLYMDIHKFMEQIQLPKPTGLPSMAIKPISTVDIEPTRLNFRLRRSPRPGEILEYEYIGES